MANVSAYPDNGLKMYTWEDEEWCIGRSPEDAALIYAGHIGPGVSDDARKPEAWTECDPWEVFNYVNGDTGETTADTFAGWVRKKGRGYFASANV